VGRTLFLDAIDIIVNTWQVLVERCLCFHRVSPCWDACVWHSCIIFTELMFSNVDSDELRMMSINGACV
jgi:hypothetical protein